MNSFLLTLTAVLIVVLGALFAAPLFIDWNDYRPAFETQASKLLGRQVKVGGKVHLTLLPAPELRFDKVAVANREGRFDQPLLEAQSIEAWLNIGALLRGAVEARKITISEPVFRLVLGEDGSGNWSDVGRPGETLPFVPKEVLLDEVSVNNGRIELLRPGQAPLVIDAVEGEASAASLSGPYRVSAAYDFQGRRQDLRFSTSASDAEGRFRLKSALRDPDRGAVYLLEGDVTGLRERPTYEGAFIVRIAPSLPAESQTESPSAAQPTTEPPADGLDDEALIDTAHLSAFELKGELNATPDHAELPSFELALHINGRSQMMKGKLAIDFGEHPKAAGELAARWIDVDTLLANGTGDGAEHTAAGALSGVTEAALEHAAMLGEGTFSMAIEQTSLGGDLVGNVDLALRTRDGAVTIDRLKAELPGENRIEASGRLIRSDGGPLFEGPIKLEGSKLRTLTRWAAGDREMSGQASVGAFVLAAKATIASNELKLEDATGKLSGTKFSGALRYRGGEQRLIDLNLDSDRLDLREVLGDSAAWRSWLPAQVAQPESASGPEPTLLASLRDDEVHVTLRVGELLLPNAPAGRLDAKFSLAKDTLGMERLDFTADGAMAVNGKGHIERLSSAPSGDVDLTLEATTVEGLRVASELFGFSEAVAKSKSLASLAPLNLHLVLTAVRAGAATDAIMVVKGKAGSADISLITKATGEPEKLAEAQFDVDGTVAGDRLPALLGLMLPDIPPDRLVLAGTERGQFTLKARGVPNAKVAGRAEFVTTSLQFALEGEGALKPDGIALTGQASAKTPSAGLALLLMGLDTSPSASGVPLELHAKIAKQGQSIDLTSITGQVAGEAVQGSAHFDTSGDKTRFALNGTVATVSLPSLLGSLVAWQRTPSTEEVLGAIGQGASGVWPTRGFALRPLETAEGEIKLEAKRLALAAPLQIEDAVLVARVDQDGLSVTDLKGRLFGGSFAASGTLSPRGAGAQLNARAGLTGGRLERASQSLAGRVLAKGSFSLSFNVAGEGLSPTGLVSGLKGKGNLALERGVLQSLTPQPFQRMALEAAKTKKIKADKDQIAAQMRSLRDKLTRGTYSYAATQLPFEVENGTLKLEPAALANNSAETTINGYVELASLRVDSEWVMRLNGKRTAEVPAVTLVFAGPLSDAGEITPAIDTAPIESYLTVRRMQEDVERLETLDVSGRNQPQVEAKPPADAPAEAKPLSEAKPQATPAASKAHPIAIAPPPLPAARPEPQAAEVEPERGAVEAMPLDPLPEQLPWAPNPAAAPSPAPAAPVARSPEQVEPAAALDDVSAPAAPRAPRAAPRAAPSRPAPAPDEWKKGISIFGGG